MNPALYAIADGALTAEVRQEDACPISSDSKYSRGEEQYDDCRRSAALSALKFLRAGTGHGKEMFEARTIAIEAHIPEQLRHARREDTQHGAAR